MNKMPERIWAYHIWSFGTGFVETNYGEWHPGVETKYRLDKTEYLRSTPLLEHAEEMRDMLSWFSTLARMGELSLMTYASPYTDGAIDQAEALKNLLATIEKAEEEGGRE